MKSGNNTKKLITSAVFAALICVSTMLISIPIPATGGYVNLGDTLVVLSGLIIGGVYGCLAAGTGSALADLILGYTYYAPGTFIIKLLMALVAFGVSKALSEKANGFIARLTAAFLAEIVMIAGYFLYESVFLGYGLGALYGIVSNVMQGVVGMVISVIVMEIVKRIRN